MDRLDEEKLQMLRTWGEGLLSDGRDEIRAAGRAVSRCSSRRLSACTSTFGTLAKTLRARWRCSQLESHKSERPPGLALHRRIKALRSRRLSSSADE